MNVREPTKAGGEHLQNAKRIDDYATDRQTTALMKWQENADTLAHILSYLIDNIL